MRFLDLTGRKFGKLLALRFVGRRGKLAVWSFGCECGDVREYLGSDITYRGIQECINCRRAARAAKREEREKARRKPRVNLNVGIAFNGEKLTLQEWGNRLGITRQAVHSRLKKYPPEIALMATKGAKVTHSFTLILGGIESINDKIQDALFEAGCDDATLSARSGIVSLSFDRPALSREAAVVSAIQSVRRANIGVTEFRILGFSA